MLIKNAPLIQIFGSFKPNLRNVNCVI
jgi:hypothetical protein